MTGIYSITNRINGKKYVGSAVDIRRRWREHKHLLCENKHHSLHLQSAWNLYREESFIFEVLERVEDKNDLVKIEQYYLDWMQTYFRENGYNVCIEAKSRLGLLASLETKEKLSKARIGKYCGENSHNFGKKRTEEARKNMSEAHIGIQAGENHPLFGKHHSIETKERISNSLVGKYCGENHPMFGKHHSLSTIQKMKESHWDNSGENHSGAILTWEDVREIREKYVPRSYSMSKLAVEYGVTKSCIRHIIKNHTWKKVQESPIY